MQIKRKQVVDERYLAIFCLLSGVGTGVDPGFTPRAHQQALSIDPFDNTCEADVVSPEAAKRGGCKTEMSTTKGISSGTNTTIMQHSYISYQLDLLCAVINLI